MICRLSFLLLAAFLFSSLSIAQPQTGDVHYFVNSNDVRRIVRDGDNLWIASFGGGLIKYNTVTGAKTHFLRTNSGIPSHLLKGVAIAKDGKIWIGTNDRGIASFDGNTWVSYTKELNGLPSNTITSLVIDSKGVLWAGTELGLIKYEGSLWKTITSPTIPNNFVLSLACDSVGSVWIGCNSDRSFTVIRNDSVNIVDLPRQYSFTQVEIDKEGTVWAGADNFVLYYYRNNKWRSVDIHEGQNPNTIYDVSGIIGLTSRSGGGMWATTPYALFRFNKFGDNDTVITHNDEKLFPSAAPGMVDYDGTLFFGSRGGLCMFDRKSWRNFSISNAGFGSNNVSKIRISPSGDVWFAAGGVHSLSKGKWRSYDVTNFSGKFDGEGITWFNEGIEDIVLKGDSLACAIIGFNGFIRYGEPFSRLYFGIRDSDLTYSTRMGIDGGDSIYIAANYGLRAFYKDSLYPYTVIGDTIKFANVNDMIFDKEGTLWFGNVYFGASKFNFTSGWETYWGWEKTLPFSSVFDFEMDSTGTIWGATDSGLVKYNYANDSWDLYRVPSALINKPDLKALAIESPTSIYACAGVLYYPETKLLHFNGSEWSEVVGSSNLLPEFGIEGIVLDKQGNLWMNTLHEGALVYRKGGPVLDVKREYRKGSALSLTIFPSPAEDRISIQLPDGANARSLSIIDILGRTVLSAPATGEPIQISHLPSGYYKVICRETDGNLITGSFTK